MLAVPVLDLVETSLKMPRLLEIQRLNRLAEGDVDGHWIEVGFFIEFVHQLAAGERNRQILPAELLQPPQRSVVVDAVVDGTAIEERLCIIHRHRPLLMVGHAVGSLKDSHHLRCIDIQAKELRVGDDRGTPEELQDQQHDYEEEVGDEQWQAVHARRPIADEGNEGNYHPEDCENKCDVVEERIGQLEGIQWMIVGDHEGRDQKSLVVCEEAEADEEDEDSA